MEQAVDTSSLSHPAPTPQSWLSNGELCPSRRAVLLVTPRPLSRAAVGSYTGGTQGRRRTRLSLVSLQES